MAVWDLVQEVLLLGDGPDLISWKWTADGTYYSTKSAYNAQLIGSYSSASIRGESGWTAEMEGKHKFFCLATIFFLK